jgi:hypothetical protein
MSTTYIIETRKGAAGIVVRDGRGFRFFAATRELSGLDGRLFATPRAAEAAAFDHLYGLNGRGSAAAKRQYALPAAADSGRKGGFHSNEMTAVSSPAKAGAPVSLDAATPDAAEYRVPRFRGE